MNRFVTNMLMPLLALMMTVTAAPALLAADAKTVDAVKEAERAWGKATAAGDEAALTKLLADDLSYTHSNGETDSKSVFIGNMKSGARKYHEVNYESIEARLYNNSAVVMAMANIKTSQKGGPQAPAHLRFLHLWVYQKGAWRLAAHQSLRLP